MESFNQAWNLDLLGSDDSEDNTYATNLGITSRDAVVFLLDSRISNLNAVCNACSAQVQELIISNTKHLIGVIVISTSNGPKVVSGLKTPCIELIAEIENLSQLQNLNDDVAVQSKETADNMNNEKQFDLNETLWMCLRLLSPLKSEAYSKRVLLFTDIDDPFPNARNNPSSSDRVKRRQVLQRSKDLFDAGIAIDVIPSNTKSTNTATEPLTFDYRKFYQHIMYKSDEELSEITESFTLESLLERVRYRMQPIRAIVSNGIFLIGRNDISPNRRSISNQTKERNDDKRSEQIKERVHPGFKLYRFAQVTNIPTKTRIDRKTNREVRTAAQTVIDQHGSNSCSTTIPIGPSDVQFETEVRGRKAIFTYDEYHSLFTNERACQLTLIGFKPLVHCFKSCYHVKPGYVLKPTDRKCYYSSRVFSALFHQCFQKNLFIVCRLTFGRSFYRIVALLALYELKPYFYVHILPFADDMRSLLPSYHVKAENERTLLPKSTNNFEICELAVDRMSELIENQLGKQQSMNGLPSSSSDVLRSVRNPSLVQFWKMLETVALNRSVLPPQNAYEQEESRRCHQDVSPIPVLHLDEKLHKLAEEFQQLVPREDNNAEVFDSDKSRKRPLAVDCEDERNASMAQLRLLANNANIKLPARCSKKQALELLRQSSKDCNEAEND